LRRFSAPLVIAVLALSLPLVVMFAMGTGTVNIAIADIWCAVLNLLFADSPSNQTNTILFDIRLPRILLALCLGAILAISGAVMQGLFRNPLADPSLIGVSGGASVGASIGAFTGGFIATILVYRLATSELGTSVTTMLLAGIAIGAIAGALNSLLSYFADNDMLRQISLWQMGNLSTANWSRVTMVALVAALLVGLFPRDSRALNALLLGESEARHLGIDVQRVKRRLIILTALGIGTSVAVAGMIGFVGLVVPHAIRLLIGPDHRWLLPGSALTGAILLILADSLARIVVTPTELPTGIITALLGAPFFIVLLIQRRREV
jgi:iron complex transport system permease protein